MIIHRQTGCGIVVSNAFGANPGQSGIKPSHGQHLFQKIGHALTIAIAFFKNIGGFVGLKACNTLSREGTPTNVTLCFSPNQALLAAKVGATYISPFIGRLDDITLDGMELIEDIRTIYDNYGYETEILAASIRTVNHVKDCALAGADVATIPTSTISKLLSHPLTDKGLAAFLADWEKTGQDIAG